MTSYADAVRSNVPLQHPRAHISYETNKRDSESSYQPKQRSNKNNNNDTKKDDQYEETSSFNEYYDDDGNIKKRFIPKEHSEKIKLEAKQKKDEKQRLEAESRRQRNDNYYRAPPRGDTYDDEWKSIREFLLSKAAPGIFERVRDINEKLEGDFKTERKTVDEKINLIWEEKDDPVKKRTKDLEKKKKFEQNNNIPGYNKEIKKKPKKDKEDEDAKPKIKTREVKGDDGFFYKKKVEVVEDKETGKLVDKDLPTVVKEETQEIKKKDKPTKEQRNAQFQNNMYEVTRYEGSFETKEAEEYKKTIKKGQATINKRENPTQQEIKPIQKISKKDKAIKEAAQKNKNNPQKNKNNQNKKPNQNDKNKQPNQNEKNQPPKDQNKNKNKNQPNKPKEPEKVEKKVEKKEEKKKPPQNNPKPVKRPYQSKEVNLKGLTEIVSKHKKTKPQWYENEQIQYAGIGVLCFVVISVIYSYVFTASTIQ